MSVAKPIPADDAKGAVIRIVQGAEETHNERLLRKLIPAWVVSGAFHVVILVGLIVVGRMQPPPTAADETIANAVVDEQEKADKAADLTNTDVGLDSELQAALPLDRQDEQNVDSKVMPDQPIGVQSDSTTPMDTVAPAGFGAGAELGVTGDLGDFAKGTGGANGSALSAGMAGRSGATKEKMLMAGGGNKDSELAVATGLLWLAAKQDKARGYWEFDGSSKNDKIASTGMSLLPFLAAGQTHVKSKDPKDANKNKYQPLVEKGLTYLVANQLPNGTFKGSSGMYSHAIAAVALCEAYGMTGDKAKLLGPTANAIKYIIAAQAADGSWGYTAGKAGDTSIVGWQIQALQSARMCKDITVPDAVLKKARGFLDKVARGALKSQYGYSSNENTTHPLSAVGLLCRYYVDGWGPMHPGMIDGVQKFTKAWMPAPDKFNMYYYYYATQVAHFHEGELWHKEWNPKMRDLLIKKQVPSSNKDLAGSWDPDTSMIGDHCGRLGTTCLALLTLEVYYRHLPLYKRDTGGLKELERVK